MREALVRAGHTAEQSLRLAETATSFPKRNSNAALAESQSHHSPLGVFRRQLTSRHRAVATDMERTRVTRSGRSEPFVDTLPREAGTFASEATGAVKLAHDLPRAPSIRRSRCGLSLRESRPVVWSETSEDGKFLASHQHVDRIDLDDSHVVERSTQMTAVNSPKGTM